MLRNLIRWSVSITVLLVPTVSNGEPKLSDEEHKQFARACYKLIKSQSKCPIPSSTFSYWPSTILNVDHRGATLKTQIQVTQQCAYSENKGWGDSGTRITESKYTCISDRVAKGDYPEPDIFEVDGNVYVRHQLIDSSGATTTWRKAHRSFEDRDHGYVSHTFYGMYLARKYFDDLLD